MSRQAVPVLTLSVACAVALTANRFVTTLGAVPAAAGNALGVNRAASTVAGEFVPVDVLGTAVIEAGAAIAAGSLVEADATGRAVTRSAGAILGRLAPAEVATAAGDFVEIVLIPN